MLRICPKLDQQPCSNQTGSAEATLAVDHDIEPVP
jgi:hypothetical protein